MGIGQGALRVWRRAVAAFVLCHRTSAPGRSDLFGLSDASIWAGSVPIGRLGGLRANCCHGAHPEWASAVGAVIAAIWARSATWARSLTTVVSERTQNGPRRSPDRTRPSYRRTLWSNDQTGSDAASWGCRWFAMS